MFRVRSTVLSLVLLVILTASVQAADVTRLSSGREVISGAGQGLAKAGGDTINLMASHDDPTNGPGEPFYYGDFEDASGNPHWNGWTHRDLTVPLEYSWTVSNYNQPDSQNHAAWCGDIDLPSCDGGVLDPDGGYGNSWHSVLEFRQAAPDPSVASIVTITATLIHDTEPGYDYTYLSYRFEDSPYSDLQVWDGAGTVPVSGEVTYLPGEYMDGTDIAVYFRVTSDAVYSDEDCSFSSAGACQIDDINVHISNGENEIDFFEDFEHGGLPEDFGIWSPITPVGVGDFAKIWTGLEDVDPCATNYSPQVAFVDDGVVVPGTGGSWCINWCYGPGGYIVTTTGGLAGWGAHIHNAIESPVMGWPSAQTPGDPTPDGINLSFSVFQHEDLSADAPGIFFTWSVRSADTDNSAGNGIQVIGDQGWVDRNFVYYGGPGYIRYNLAVADWMESGRDSLQVQLAVYELGWAWGWVGDDGYPAPYFDDVTVKIYPLMGPAISAAEIDLAQDNFPARGSIDLNDLGAHSVRFDMARNIAPDEHLRNDPGDSIVVRINSVREGAELFGEPRLNYILDANPVFESYRTAGLPSTGWVAGSPASNGTTIIPDHWAFDLPDTGFLFPGDVLHYYISAVDAVNGMDPQTSLVPTDTTGFATGFDDPGGYHPVFSMRALPMIDGNKDVFIPYTALFINDGARGAELEKWYSVFDRYRMKLGVDYDIYHVNGPSSGVGNGIGGRANAQLLSDYTDIFYTSGNMDFRTLGEGDLSGDPGDDVGTLAGWIDLGEKDIFLAGDGLAGDLAYTGSATQDFLDIYMGLTFLTSDVRQFISNQAAPRIQPTPTGWPNQIFSSSFSWIAFGGCPVINQFDGVQANPSAVRSAEFLDPSGYPNQYVYSAVTLNTVGSSRVLSMPMDLGYIVTDPNSGAHPELGHIDFMEDILFYFDILRGVGDAPPAVPDYKFNATNHPNPFNPVTTITYSLPKTGHLQLSIYDVRGRLIKTLIDDVKPAGANQTAIWDGSDNRGSAAASGIYFFEARVAGEVKIGKMTLLK